VDAYAEPHTEAAADVHSHRSDLPLTSRPSTSGQEMRNE
jgi:hypothetical protein